MRPQGRTAIVVGGGPGGLMAAEVLATAGWAVTVHDHMPSVGRKLLLAGRGGLNITHSEPLAAMLPRYGSASARLEAALNRFGPAELRAWCAGLGEPTVVGTSGRVFPASFRATPLLRAWLRRLAELGVSIVVRDRWVGWGDGIDGRTLRFARADGTLHDEPYDVAVLALGGASWPRVGSDGGWTAIMRDEGVMVQPFRPSNGGVRVAWSSELVDRFAGVPLKNIAVGVVPDTDERQGHVVRGDAMLTASGLEGGPLYALSVPIREALDRDGSATLRVDLCPDLDAVALLARLGRRRPKDSVANALRRSLGLTPAAVAVLRDITANRIPSDTATLASLVKAAPITVDATMPIGRAISSAGGIDLGEVNDDFMLRRVPGTFVVGEMLDWEAPTGGYLLQATFSTAVVAAEGATAWAAGSTTSG